MPVTENDIIRMEIQPRDMNVVAGHARLACIGGKSNIRGASRQATLKEDQLVGQIGQYVGSLWLSGSADSYLRSRWVANQNPTVGDGGSDLIGSNIDFKTSLVRSPDRDLLSYRLAVRPKERHQDWVYVLVLVTKMKPPDPVVAHLIGWAADYMLPKSPNDSGVFSGAFTIPARNLHPLPPFKWFWGI